MKLGGQKAERVAKLDARQRLLAEEEAAQQAYAKAVVAGKACISRCALAATDQKNSNNTVTAPAQVASRLRKLVEEYTEASWKTSITGVGVPRSRIQPLHPRRLGWGTVGL